MSNVRQKSSKNCCPFSALPDEVQSCTVSGFVLCGPDTLCDIVLPKIMGVLTNTATDGAAVLTVQTVLRLAALTLCCASSTEPPAISCPVSAILWVVHIETDNAPGCL